MNNNSPVTVVLFGYSEATVRMWEDKIRKDLSGLDFYVRMVVNCSWVFGVNSVESGKPGFLQIYCNSARIDQVRKSLGKTELFMGAEVQFIRVEQSFYPESTIA